MRKGRLRVDDTYIDTKVLESGTYKNVMVHQVIAVKHTNGIETVSYLSATYELHPHAFSAVPESIAIELCDREEYDILSMSEAKKYIDKAKEMARKGNADIEEYNDRVRAHNKKHEATTSLQKPLKKWRHIEGNSPYQHFMNRKRSKKRKE